MRIERDALPYSRRGKKTTIARCYVIPDMSVENIRYD
jgi:hypothetical protein